MIFTRAEKGEKLAVKANRDIKYSDLLALNGKDRVDAYIAAYYAGYYMGALKLKKGGSVIHE